VHAFSWCIRQRERGSGSESESNARRKEEGEKKTEVFMIPAKEVCGASVVVNSSAAAPDSL